MHDTAPLVRGHPPLERPERKTHRKTPYSVAAPRNPEPARAGEGRKRKREVVRDKFPGHLRELSLSQSAVQTKGPNAQLRLLATHFCARAAPLSSPSRARRAAPAGIGAAPVGESGAARHRVIPVYTSSEMGASQSRAPDLFLPTPRERPLPLNHASNDGCVPRAGANFRLASSSRIRFALDEKPSQPKRT